MSGSDHRDCYEEEVRLIDAGALKRDIMSYKTMTEIRKAICEVIDNAPTVEERPHGKWEECENSLYMGGGYTKCSNCETIYSWGGYHEVFEFAFCPNCGAEMKDGTQ